MKKQNKKTIKVSKPKVHKYPEHYLALVLIGFLLVEGILISSTGKADWARGAQLLDVSSAVSQTLSDTALVFQPMADTVAAVHEFYIQAATAMIPMLDISGSLSDAGIVFDGVNEFYQQAATEMTRVLDVSDVSMWPAKVAGASITFTR
jgi:hypothetical protein